MENQEFDLAQSKPNFADKLEDAIYRHPWRCAFGLIVIAGCMFALIWRIPG